MQKPSIQMLVLALVAGTVFFTNLGQARLWDRDEPRNAGCAAEMLARGELVVPLFNDQLRQQKPALLYWLMMLAYQFLGIHEFSARFWSATLAVVTVLGTWSIGRRLYGDSVGTLAGIALATSLMFVVAARAATPDSLLIACVTTALMIYVRGTFGLQAHSDWKFFPTSRSSVVGFYAVLGLAVLAKGPVGFLLPMATIGLFGMIEAARGPEGAAAGSTWRRWIATLSPLNFWHTLWRMQPLLGVAVVLLVAGPWFLWVHIRTDGDFTRLFFLSENFGRATAPLENHGGGLWFYPVAILIGFFPWSCFWGPTAVTIWKQRWPAGSGSPAPRELLLMRANTFLLCWIGIQVGAFSLAQTKLPSYVTPCYPALALLTAHCLVSAVSQQAAGQRRQALGAAWIPLGLIALTLTGLGLLGGGYLALRQWLPSQASLALVGLVPLLGGAILTLAWARKRWSLLTPGLSLVAILFAVLLFGWGTSRLDQEQQSQRILTPIRQSDLPVAAYGCLESSWVFYGGHPITELDPSPQATDAALTLPVFGGPPVRLVSHPLPAAVPARSAFWKPVPRQSVAQWRAQHPRSFVITTAEHWETLRPQLPPDYRVVEQAPYFLKRGQTLLLIGPADLHDRPGA